MRPLRVRGNSEVFISYRTDDASWAAALIDERLRKRFGDARVFRDARSIRPGEDYPERLLRAVRAASVLLVLVDRNWAASFHARAADAGGTDWVRREIAEARAADVPIIPILLNNAPPLTAAELPDDLAFLAHVQALHMSHTTVPDLVARIVDEIAPRIRRPPLLIASAALLVVGVAAAALLLLRPFGAGVPTPTPTSPAAIWISIDRPSGGPADSIPVSGVGFPHRISPGSPQVNLRLDDRQLSTNPGYPDELGEFTVNLAPADFGLTAFAPGQHKISTQVGDDTRYKKYAFYTVTAPSPTR